MPKPKCIQILKNGKRCKNGAIDGLKYCRDHNNTIAYGNESNYVTVEFPHGMSPYYIDGRYIVKATLVIDGKLILSSAFYNSSGTNTGPWGERKWFPTDGVIERSLLQKSVESEVDGGGRGRPVVRNIDNEEWKLAKLSTLSYLSGITTIEDNCRTSEVDDKMMPIRCRMGNYYYMFVSYIMGGWDNVPVMPEGFSTLADELIPKFAISAPGPLVKFREAVWSNIDPIRAITPSLTTINEFINTSVSHNYFGTVYAKGYISDLYSDVVIEVFNNHGILPVNVMDYLNSHGIIKMRSQRPARRGLFTNFYVAYNNISIMINSENAYYKRKFKREMTASECKSLIDSKIRDDKPLRRLLFPRRDP